VVSDPCIGPAHEGVPGEIASPSGRTAYPEQSSACGSLVVYHKGEKVVVFARRGNFSDRSAARAAFTPCLVRYPPLFPGFAALFRDRPLVVKQRKCSRPRDLRPGSRPPGGRGGAGSDRQRAVNLRLTGQRLSTAQMLALPAAAPRSGQERREPLDGSWGQCRPASDHYLPVIRPPPHPAAQPPCRAGWPRAVCWPGWR
jgi:hypothetical protein